MTPRWLLLASLCTFLVCPNLAAQTDAGTPDVAPAPSAAPADTAPTPDGARPEAPPTVPPPPASPASPAAQTGAAPSRTVTHRRLSTSELSASAPASVSTPRAQALQTAPPVARKPNRAARRFAIAGEIGWNSLAGLGANFSYHPIPELALDTGLGLSQVGLKLGARARWNVLDTPWTPIAGVGFLYGLGSGNQDLKLTVNGDPVTLRLRGSPYLQTVAGVNYTGDGGFLFMATAGWAFLLRDNAEFVSGSRTAFDKVRPVFGGGIVIAAAIGHAF